MKDYLYYKQAELLLRILPLIMSEPDFALKGGAAINFFVREIPRLSVDIDLTYCLLTERQTALTDISQHLRNISTKITRSLPKSVAVFKTLHNSPFLQEFLDVFKQIEFETFRVMLDLVKIQMNMDYHPTPGREDTQLNIHLLKARENPVDIHTLQQLWQEDIHRPIEVSEVAGNHFSMLQAENVSEIAAAIKEIHT